MITDDKKDIPDFYEERDMFGQIKAKVEVTNLDEPDISETKPPELNVTYASLADRIIAYSIDAVLIFILISVTVYILAENDISLHSTSISLLSLLLWTLYYGFLESSEKQATLGKMIMHLKVIDVFGNRISFRKAALRYLATGISIVPLGFGIWCIAKDIKKQGWHDMLLDCFVIKEA